MHRNSQAVAARTAAVLHLRRLLLSGGVVTPMHLQAGCFDVAGALCDAKLPIAYAAYPSTDCMLPSTLCAQGRVHMPRTIKHVTTPGCTAYRQSHHKAVQSQTWC